MLLFSPSFGLLDMKEELEAQCGRPVDVVEKEAAAAIESHVRRRRGPSGRRR